MCSSGKWTTVEDLQPMDAVVAKSVATPRFNLALLGSLAASALILVAVGIYGVLAFSVALRSKELAVRVVTRWMTTLLFEVESLDPATFASVAALQVVVAAVACYVPARRAAGTDPITALRAD